MKKVFSVIAIAALAVSIVSCGPSKEEMEAAAKRVSDSIAADSMAKAAAAQATADSIAAAAAAAADTTKPVEAATEVK